MKYLIPTFTLLAVFLTACASTLTVATPEELDMYPEQESLMNGWQELVDAALIEDCEAFLDHTRSTLEVSEDECVDIFNYFAEDNPPIDWSKTAWSSTGSKAKIYEVNQGSLTGVILDESTDLWKVDTRFWR